MKVFAHRGISALFPENSRSAILACDKQPFEGIEVDLYQVERNFFVLHDRWLTRLFGINKHIDEFNAKEMEALHCKDGKPIPTLEWLIETLAKNDLSLNLELKKITDVALFLSELIAVCQKHEFNLNRLIISSFNHTYLQQAANIAPNLKLGLLVSAHPVNIKCLLNDFPLYSVHINIDCLSKSLIGDIHEQALKVFVFTVDQQSEIDWLKQNNVDAIFANDPLQAYKFINFFE